jgi:outer membrane lipoprotein-sorting protein
MRKVVLAVLILSGLAGKSLAQAKTPFGQSDPKAKEILDAASKQFKTYKTVKADFVLKINTADQKLLDSKTGTVYLKGTRYKVLLNGQEIYCDGETIWTYNKDTKEVQINTYTPDNGTITPSRLFTNFYDKEFLYRLDGTASYKGKTTDVIEMTPLDKSKPFFKVVVQVDRSSHNIVNTKIFEKGGNQYTYEVTSFTTNMALDDKSFVFDTAAHPGVDVVDLR